MVAKGQRQERSLTPLSLQAKKALLFDIDGVLVDTEGLHFRAFSLAFHEVAGISISLVDYVDHGISTDPNEFCEKVLVKNGLDTSLGNAVVEGKRRIFEQLVAREGIAAFPDAICLVRLACECGLPQAVVTAERRARVLRTLVDLGIASCFSVIASGDSGRARNKPHPDLYINALSELRIPPVEGLAIEDSQNGVRAALSAGLDCVAIPNSYTATHDFGGALVVPSAAVLMTLLELGEKS